MTLLIPSRFCGPATSGNGGWSSGALAARHPDAVRGGGITVRLLSPPPLDRTMDLRLAGGTLEASTSGPGGEVLVARATPAVDPEPSAIPEPVTFAVAQRAAEDYPGWDEHPFTECFTCGTDREPGDALCLRPGPVEGRDVFAAGWVPTEATAPIVWAALDCPGAWALGVGGRPMVLGTMTTWITRLPAVGDEHVVIAWAGEQEGRKHGCGTALFAGDELLAHSVATWIQIDPATFGQA